MDKIEKNASTRKGPRELLLLGEMALLVFGAIVLILPAVLDTSTLKMGSGLLSSYQAAVENPAEVASDRREPSIADSEDVTIDNTATANVPQQIYDRDSEQVPAKTEPLWFGLLRR